VKWYHGDERIKPKKGEKRIRSGYDNNNDMYVLQIQSAMIEDSGQYSVKVSNEHGSVKATVRVSISKEKKTMDFMSENTVIIKSEESILTLSTIEDQVNVGHQVSESSDLIPPCPVEANVTRPDIAPGSAPDSVPDKALTSAPNKTPDSAPGKAPDSLPDKALTSAPDKTPDSTPGKAPDSSPDKAPASASDKALGSAPHGAPQLNSIQKIVVEESFKDDEEECTISSEVVVNKVKVEKEEFSHEQQSKDTLEKSTGKQLVMEPESRSVKEVLLDDSVENTSNQQTSKVITSEETAITGISESSKDGILNESKMVTPREYPIAGTLPKVNVTPADNHENLQIIMNILEKDDKIQKAISSRVTDEEMEQVSHEDLHSKVEVLQEKNEFSKISILTETGSENLSSQTDTQGAVSGQGPRPVFIEKPQSVSAMEGSPFLLFCKVQG